MTVSINLDEEVIRKIKRVADQQHRSFSGQVAFFCAEGLSNLLKPDPKPTTEEDAK